MDDDSKVHHRRSIRLKGYDYSRVGAYFVTIVAFRRACVFGEIAGGDMILNEAGRLVERAWLDLPHHYRHVELGAFVIMPDHVHGIIVLNDGCRGGSSNLGQSHLDIHSDVGAEHLALAGTRPYETHLNRHALPEIVRAFKSFSARRINQLQHSRGCAVWQRNYYEHIIRNEREMEKVSLCISTNPMRWATDPENPALVPVNA